MNTLRAFLEGPSCLLILYRLLDKIAKDIMVCENKTVRRWDGSIGEYKNYLRKKMVSMGQV
jgi:ATP-binding cassette, subfamily F, member 2